jgi:peptide/nickel transport system substrate-binding protein
MEPLTQLSFQTSLGYNKALKGRSYNPAKAKQLLSEAGYPNGFQTKITVLADPFYRDIATTIQGYLATVGIDAKLDVADKARFNELTISTGGQSTWNNGLILVNLPTNPGMSFFRMFLRVFEDGGRYRSLTRSPEFNKIVDKINSAQSEQELVILSQQMVAQAYNDQLSIPVLALPCHYLYNKFVHTTAFSEIPTPGLNTTYKDWMEKK